MHAPFCALSPRRCEIFPLHRGGGGEPVGKAGRAKRRCVFGKGGFFSEKWRGKAKNRELFASALAEGRTASGKWRDEEARWRCAEAWLSRRGRRQGSAGGGGARNNVYLCGRLTDFFPTTGRYFYDSLPHFGVACAAHFGRCATLALPSTDLRTLAGTGADGGAHAPPYAPTVVALAPQSAVPQGLTDGGLRCLRP